MGVLINKKRCDNADICPCIEGCPTNAFYWDKENETVAVNNALCVNCRQCVIDCEAGAVKVARDDEEYEKIKTEYDEDIMTEEELFQDRFGASIVDEIYNLNIDKLEELTEDSNKKLLIEFYNDDEANCLINSIPIIEIINKFKSPISYRKINLSEIELVKKYDINELPSLIVIDNKKVIFKHEGFIDYNEKQTLLNKFDE